MMKLHDRLVATGAAFALGLVSSLAGAQAQDRTYTLDADFAEGIQDAVNSDAPNNDQLQLGGSGSTFPVMWIANAGEDTVSRIDTDNDCETARYRTWHGPRTNHSAFAGPAPSRTAVDGDGNVYVANRHFDGQPAAVLKILAEGGIDRNGNGVIDTSVDTNGDCAIDASELILHNDDNGDGILTTDELDDERIAWIVQVGSRGALGRSLCLDPQGDLWLGLFGTRQYYELSSVDGSVKAGPIATTNLLSPYGCVVESDGTLWSASLSSRTGELDTNTKTWTATRNGPASNYGIGFGGGKPHWANSSRGGWYTYDKTTNTFQTRAGVSTLALSVGTDADVYHGGGAVRRANADGTDVWTTANPRGSGGNRGVLIDSNGDIWSVNLSNNSVSKFRGSDGMFLGEVPVGFQPYTYSDATGFAFRTQTNPSGFWTVVYDSGESGNKWDNVNWNNEPQGSVPNGAVLSAQVRAADAQGDLQLQPYADTGNGDDLGGLMGRFIQVRMRFEPNDNGLTPVLSDLMIKSVPEVAAMCDWNGDGQTDRADIALMGPDRNKSVPPGDPRFDLDADGIITVLDIRKCVLACTNARCAS